MSGFQRSARSHSGTRWTSPGRRAAAALVVPAAFLGVLFAGSPASAAATPTTNSICDGVLNQLRNLGTVQENLLKAAARQNADLIASMTAQRAALQAQRVDLLAQIDRVNQQLADLEAEGIELDEGIKTRHIMVDSVLAERAGIADQVAGLQKALAGLQAQQGEVQVQLDALVAQLTDLNAEGTADETVILDLQTRIAALLTQLDQLNEEISAMLAQLATLQGQLMSLDVQVTTAEEALRNLEAQQKANNDAIAAQTAILQGLEDTLASIEDQIGTIDRTIALGGCAA